MDEQTLEALEFPKVVERILNFATSEPGRRIVEKLRPTVDLKRIRREAARTTEVRRVMEATGRFPVDGIRDVAAVVAKARIPGAVLPPSAFLDLASTLEAARTLRDFLLNHGGDKPALSRTARELYVLTGLTRRIASTVDEAGTILDEASEDLRAIRAELRAVEDRIRDSLRAFIEAPEAEEQLQDAYFTIREGRHVLPVRANMKADVPGIVHDRSDTGQTVFIEPAAVVSLGNDLRDLHSLERVEETRILTDLTRAVQESTDAIEANQKLLARADADRARASFSMAFDCSEPQVAPDGPLLLRRARHPVLLFAGVDAVPVDVAFTEEERTLVITGPNAGGKTVTLKTVGLLALMAQAGLHVPAGERSAFRLFRRVYADIGDMQSIEESLSSFSSHMVRIAGFLGTVGDDTLVLLDELGAATDPEEGGALSSAVLQEIHGRGAFTAATTHLSDLKILAHGTQGMTNASAQFDPGTGHPTYQIKTGTPGTSRAIETARRLGFPPDLLTRARGFLSEGKARLEETIADLEAEAVKVLEERSALERARTEAQEERDGFRNKIRDLRKEKKDVLRKAAGEAAETLKRGRKIVEDTIRSLREEAAPAAADEKERKKAFRKARQTVDKALEVARSEEARLSETEVEGRLSPAAVEVGAEVTVVSLGQTGRITSLDAKRGKVKVSAGILEIEADLADLAPGKVRKKAPVRPPPEDRYKEFRRDVEPELVLVGQRVEAAEGRLKAYLDDAVFSGRETVRVVHGMGTGRLRRFVHDFLRQHPAVASFRPGARGEGGEGATVVRLRD